MTHKGTQAPRRHRGLPELQQETIGTERLPIAASWIGEVQPPATRISVRYCRKVSGTSSYDSRIVFIRLGRAATETRTPVSWSRASFRRSSREAPCVSLPLAAPKVRWFRIYRQLLQMATESGDLLLTMAGDVPPRRSSGADTTWGAGYASTVRRSSRSRSRSCPPAISWMSCSSLTLPA